jgi:hypothetical protein
VIAHARHAELARVEKVQTKAFVAAEVKLDIALPDDLYWRSAQSKEKFCDARLFGRRRRSVMPAPPLDRCRLSPRSPYTGRCAVSQRTTVARILFGGSVLHGPRICSIYASLSWRINARVATRSPLRRIE